jgi:hypothetical protein
MGVTCSSSSISLLLLVITRIGWPLNLYRFPLLTPRTTAYLKLDPLGRKNTYPSRNNISWYPFFSISKIEIRLLLSFVTHNTFDTFITSPDSRLNDTAPDPCIACLVPISISTHKSKLVFVKVSNNARMPVIWKDALLSTNPVPLLEIVPEREETNTNSLWNVYTTSSTSIVDSCCLLPLPFWRGHYEAYYQKS